MIIVQLLGGLGNQLFQYAAARRLAAEKGVPLKLDKSRFADYQRRTYKLHHFQVQADFATPAEVDRFIGPGLVRKGQRWLDRRLRPYYQQRVYQQPESYTYDPRFLDVLPEVYLIGHFHNLAYFTPITAEIRQAFTFADAPDAANVALAAAIHAANAVSIHIRRGDYVTNPDARARHGLLPLAYYHTAAAAIADQITDPHFFVFSDDPAWVAANLTLDYPVTYVDHNDANHDYADLCLLSLCQHHIIANSSFSWWGAWLCDHPGKIVYAPARWLASEQIDARSFSPADWRYI